MQINNKSIMISFVITEQTSKQNKNISFRAQFLLYGLT